MGASVIPEASSSSKLSPWTQITTSSLAAIGSLSFTSISTSYSELLVFWNSAYMSGVNTLKVRFNSDTGNSYSYSYLDSSAGTTGALLQSEGRTSTGVIMGSVATATGTRSSGSMLIQGANDLYKTITSNNAVSVAGYAALNGTGNWFSTDSITTLDFIGSTSGDTFTAGTVTLYGRS